MSIKTQIENYTGSIPVALTDDTLESLLANGVSDIVKKIKLSSPEDLWLFTRTSTVPSEGLNVESSSVYDVHMVDTAGLWKGASPIPIAKRYQAADKDSIGYATGEFPVYYLEDKRVKVLPDNGESDSETVTAYSDWSGDTNYTKVTLSSILSGITVGQYLSISRTDEATISSAEKYYIGVHRVHDTVSNYVIIERDYNSGVAITNTVATQAYAVCSTVYIPRGSDIDISGETLDYFPRSYMGILILYGAMMVLQRRISDMYSNLPVLILPAIPVAPLMVESSVSVGSYTPPVPYIPPVRPSNSTIDFSGIPDTPTIEKILAPPITFFSFPLTTIDISNLTLDELPTPPINPDYTSISIDYTTIVRSKEPEYIKPVMVFPAFPALSELSLPAVPVGPGGPDFSDGQSSAADSNIPLYIPAVTPYLDFAQVETFIETDEDSELASAQIQKIQTQLQEMQSQSQEQLNIFNSDMNEYKSKIEQSLSNATKQLDADNQEYQAKLSQYQADVQTYQIDTNNILAKWGKEEIEHKFSKWGTECTNALQQYQNDIQNNLNLFNEQTSIYQAEIQKAQGDAQNKVSTESSQYQSILGKYQSELESYKAKTANQVAEWTNQIVQPKMTEYATKRNDEMQKWNSDNQLALTKHNQEVQEEASRIQNETSIWQGDVSKRMQAFTAEDGSDIAKYQAEIQSETSRYDADIRKSLEEYNADINKLNSDVAKIQELNQSRIAKSNYDMQMYTAESQNAIQDFQADLTKDEKEFNFYLNQYQIIKDDYNSNFMVPNNKEQ